MAIDLSILIVNWNTRERTLACINSIRKFVPAQAGVQIIVIDNDSEDGSVEVIRESGVDVEIIETFAITNRRERKKFNDRRNKKARMRYV